MAEQETGWCVLTASGRESFDALLAAPVQTEDESPAEGVGREAAGRETVGSDIVVTDAAALRSEIEEALSSRGGPDPDMGTGIHDRHVNEEVRRCGATSNGDEEVRRCGSVPPRADMLKELQDLFSHNSEASETVESLAMSELVDMSPRETENIVEGWVGVGPSPEAEVSGGKEEVQPTELTEAGSFAFVHVLLRVAAMMFVAGVTFIIVRCKVKGGLSKSFLRAARVSAPWLLCAWKPAIEPQEQ